LRSNSEGAIAVLSATFRETAAPLKPSRGGNRPFGVRSRLSAFLARPSEIGTGLEA
jgi:hypothetical protein